MPLLTLILVLVIVGVVLWLINNYVPMQSGVKRLLNVVVIIVLVIWVLDELGLFDSLKQVRI